MNPKVSIIVPIYNVEQYIYRCLDTLTSQTLKDIEIILIDDGSPDNCPKICDEYAVKDERIKVVHKNNEGLGLARNSGIEIASGEYIAFVDSDDYVTLDMCELLYNEAKENNADVVYGGIFYDNGKTIRAKSCVRERTIWNSKEKVKELLLDLIGTNPNERNDTIMEVSVWKALFKKSIFDDYNIKFESERKFISEDIIFDIDFLRFCQCVVVIPNAVYYYCVNPNSLSKTFRTDRFRKVKILYFEILRKLNCIYINTEFQERTDRFLIARARSNARKIVHHRGIIGNDEMMRSLKEICEDKELTNILDRYQLNKLPLKYYIIAFLMKNRSYRLLQIILRK
ncbi:glycosyltransferase family 2 protein [Clostridium culturomicium]|uniref:glycosyltransferase family 2 protein n=1 Tax=Clostridium culturomicium TaxID=1499683 RepID=UPI00385725E3